MINFKTEICNLANERNRVQASVKQSPTLEDEAVRQLLPVEEKEGQVIVHCTFKSTGESLRIWKTTFLTDKGSAHRSRLLHAENITFYPAWTTVPKGKTVIFTLIFSPLPKNCKSFNLIEEINQPGGFFISAIKRNKTDVYRVNIH